MMIKPEKIYLLICAAFAAGEALGFVSYILSPLWILAAFTAVVAAVFCCSFRTQWTYLIPSFFLGLTLAFFTMNARVKTLRDVSIETRRTPFQRSFVVEGEAMSYRGKRDAQTRWVSFLSSYSNIAIRIIAPVSVTNAFPRIGETWECAGWLDTRTAPTDLRPRRLWVKGRHTFARRIASAPKYSLRGTFVALRHNFSRRMGIGLEHSAPDIADLNRAILLGERASLPKDIRDTFIRAGTMHVFAISGLHVMIVAQLLMVLLACCGIPRRLSGLLLVPLLWSYTYLIGLTPSAIRAAGMASIYFAAYIFMRCPNALVAWCLTFLIIHIFDPLMLLNVGCELSFAVMLGILLSIRFVRHFNFGRWESFFITVAAWVAGTPIAAHVFGRVTPGGILANLILIPTAAVSVISSALGILTSFISTSFAAHINNLAALFTRGMVAISWAVSHTPGSNFETSQWTFTTCLIWYAIALAIPWLIIIISRRRRRVL